MEARAEIDCPRQCCPSTRMGFNKRKKEADLSYRGVAWHKPNLAVFVEGEGRLESDESASKARRERGEEGEKLLQAHHRKLVLCE